MPSRLFYTLLLCALVTSVPAPADILPFLDSTFDPANYNFSNPPVISGGVTNYSYGPCAACGNPADPLETSGFEASITTNGPGGAFVGFLNNTFNYNPKTQGAINSIDTSVDKNLSVDPSSTDFTSNYYPLLEQGGNFYSLQIPGPALLGTTTGYTTIGQDGLTYNQFNLFDFATQSFDTNSHPDFSTQGAQITLGFAPLITANGPFNITADYDNLSFDINYSGTTTQSPVPESSSLGLLSIFLMGLVLRGLRPAVRWKLKRH